MAHKRKETTTKKMSKWSDSETDRLVSLVVAGHTIESITAKLNRTYHSVSCKVSELRSNGIILPKLKKSTKKIRYEMDHVDSIGPLLSSGAKEVTVPLVSPVTSAYAKNLSKNVKFKKTSLEGDAQELMLLCNIQKNRYSATLSFKKGKLTHIVID
jgi:hypothetical protein